MFTLPIACFLMMAPGQAVKVDENTAPDALLRKVEQVLVKGDVLEIIDLRKAIMGALNKTKNSYQKDKLEQAALELKTRERTVSERNFVLKSIVNNRDKRVALLGLEVDKAIGKGRKEDFLALRGELEAFLKNWTSEMPVDQMGKFMISKALEDMNHLVQLDQDPVKRAETERLFANLAGEESQEEPYPGALGETPKVRRGFQMLRDAGRLFGPTSYIRFWILDSVMFILANECCKGQMPDVDLQAEIEREFEPFLQSEWAQNWVFKKKLR